MPLGHLLTFSYFIQGNVNRCYKSIGLSNFRKFYGKRKNNNKQWIFLTIFYIFNKGDIKIFLKQSINKYPKGHQGLLLDSNKCMVLLRICCLLIYLILEHFSLSFSLQLSKKGKKIYSKRKAFKESTLKQQSNHINRIYYHHAPLVRWSLHKYKCLWGVGSKGRDSSIQEKTSHTYTLKLC